MKFSPRFASFLLASAAILGPVYSGAAHADELQDSFQNPPQSARPRVWWHWMNGNITEDGIAKDMAWMKRVGIGGLQNFDANLQTPQIVEKRLVYMTPEWKHAFHFAATEADRQGLELTIAASPGWSETGGPWVPAEDGLKKLVWSETKVIGGKRYKAKLAHPPITTGPFQDMVKPPSIEELMAGGATHKKADPQYYSDIAVLAIPETIGNTILPKANLSDGSMLDVKAMMDSSLETGADIPRDAASKPSTILLSYDKPQSIESATLFVHGAKVMYSAPTIEAVLEAQDKAGNWLRAGTFTIAEVPTTISFAPVTASQFRLVLTPTPPKMANMGAIAPGIDLGGMAALAGGAGGNAPYQVRQLSLTAETQIDNAESKAGFSLVNDYFTLPNPSDGASGPDVARIVNLTDKMKSDGTLDWVAPKGSNWRIIRLGASLLGTTNHPAPAEATGLEVDKFDGAAVRRYMEHYIGMYRDAAGSDMIGKRGVQAILTDSIEVGAANWTPKMVAQFTRLRGYDPTPWLPTLAGILIGTRAQSDNFLFDYRRTLADLMASEHYGTVAAVAHENGLKVYGEALEDHRPSLGDDMAMRKYTDIPMSAMWTHSLAAGPRLSYLADIKGAASVAHIYGQNLVAAESMTSALNYWSDSPSSLKHVIDLEFVTGVNRPVIHTSVHQPTDDKIPGLSLFIFGQYFNRHEAWAEMAKPWVDYMSRNALMLQQGHNVADVGYFYGEEAPLTGLYGDKMVDDAPKTHAYDFVNADVLSDAIKVDGDRLVTAGGAQYRALYLGGSSQHMTLPTLRRIAALADAGATVIGTKPVGNPSLAGDAAEYSALVAKLWGGAEETAVGKGRVIASSDIETALGKIGIISDFRFTGGQEGADIPFIHRKLDDGDSYFLVNRTARAESIEAHFRVTGKTPELWRAETGTAELLSYRIENGETIVPLNFAAEESYHIVLRKAATVANAAIKAPEFLAASQLDGAWSVRFQSGRGAPASTTLPTLKPLSENADAGIKYFSGIATYAKDFTTPKGWKVGQPLWIDLGKVGELAEISVNGKAAGAAWHAPYKIDIGAATKQGKNHLEIKVADLWVNRLIGDAQKDAQKITFTSMPTYLASAPLRPSGLIGPVQLFTAKP